MPVKVFYTAIGRDSILFNLPADRAVTHEQYSQLQWSNSR